jgi:DNA-binding transcriptional MocR family regulator
VWDISDEEIAEWRRTPAMMFVAGTAERIRNGEYDNGQELYPHPQSVVYREVSKAMVDADMALLAARGMVRKSPGGGWYAIAPGRLEPSVRRAVAVLLGRRDDLPAALAAELDSWKRHLDTLEGGDGAQALQGQN